MIHQGYKKKDTRTTKGYKKIIQTQNKKITPKTNLSSIFGQ